MFAAEAAPVTPEEALSRLAGERAIMSAPSGIRLMRTVDASDGMPAVYVFGTGDAVSMFVSADDLARPLLGRLDSAPSAGEDMPVQLEEWLADISESIMEARSRNLSPVRVVESGDDVATRKAIEPLLSTKWGQGNPYNAMCPKIMNSSTGREEPALTGCVATALAQLIYHNRYPKRSTGTGSAASGETMDLDIEYDFDNMLDTYSGEYNYFQGVAVSRLMVACGFAVEMDYGLGASGANIINAEKALRTNFGYSKAEYYESTLFSREEWKGMLYDNLKAGYPVYYSGSGRDGGHAFVIDGYKDDYFHFNWGWTGTYDGYFLLDYLIPAGDYHRRQSAIINIVPADDDYCYEVPEYLYVSEIKQSGSKGVKVSFWNHGDVDHVYNIGLIFESISDKSDRFSVVRSREVSVPGGRGYAEYSLSLAGADVEKHLSQDAVYKVMPAYGCEGEELKPMRHYYDQMVGCFYYDVYRGEASVSVPGVSFSSIMIFMSDVPASTYATGRKSRNTMPVNLSGLFWNYDPNNEVCGVVRPVLLKSIDEEMAIDRDLRYEIVAEGLTSRAWLCAGERQEFSLTTDFVCSYNTYMTPGTYKLAIMSDNVVMSDLYDFEVKDYPGFAEPLVNTFDAAGHDGVLPMDDLSFDVEITGGEGIYDKQLSVGLWLFRATGGNSVEALQEDCYPNIMPGEPFKWHVTFKSEKAQPGMMYIAQVFGAVRGLEEDKYNFTGISKQLKGKIGEASAIDDIFAEGDAEGIGAEAPVYDLTGRMVAPRFGDAQLAPGIYMVGTRKIAVR